MKHFSFVVLITLTIAFVGSVPEALSQSLVDSHVAAVTGFDIDESPMCDLTKTQTPHGCIACNDGVQHEIVPVERGKRSIPLLVPETRDAEQLFKALVSNSQKRHYCVRPDNPSSEQSVAFGECMENLPDCDRRTWD